MNQPTPTHPIKSTRPDAREDPSGRVALPSIYPALTRLTESAIEALFSEAEGSDDRARLTKQEEA